MRGWRAAALLRSCIETCAAIERQDAATHVVVYMDGGRAWVPGAVVRLGQAETSRLFLDEGIHLEWRHGKPPRLAAELPEAGNIVPISFRMSTPAQFELPGKMNALAFAQPYGSGPLPITVLGDRVARFLAPYGDSDAGRILGHILAHEIGHTLEGIARHSDSGVMKASWDVSDLEQMRRTGLSFAAPDQHFLRQHFAVQSEGASCKIAGHAGTR